jgi:hypothetical protein
VSGVYIYCVVPDALPPADSLAGIDDAPVRGFSRDGVCVWHSSLEQRPAASIQRVRRHNEIVAAPMAQDVTPVPFRFGQWLGDAADLPARVSARAPAWRALLERVAGTCELGVRARWAEESTARDVQPAGPGGRAYLEEIARQHARTAALRTEAERLATELSAAVGRLALDERVDTGAVANLAVAHLVRRADVADYFTAVERVQKAHHEVEFAVTGPWPPYSFAG